MNEDSKGNKRFPGIYRGTVTNSKDPLNNRRIKMTVPQVLGEASTDWSWPMDSAGVYFTPPTVGQGVWVMFEGGDPSFPVWSSTFGKYQGKGYQVKITDLAKESYPATITRNIQNNEFDVIAAIADLANKVEEIRISLNAHGGGASESSPTDVDA
jgi:hypothetical protein